MSIANTLVGGGIRHIDAVDATLLDFATPVYPTGCVTLGCTIGLTHRAIQEGVVASGVGVVEVCKALCATLPAVLPVMLAVGVLLDALVVVDD